MLAGLALGSEIKRFGRSQMTRAAIVVLTMLPLVYGALYLWAFWDPFGHVNKLPVALVNADRGAVVSGQQINVGNEIAKGLTVDRGLDWHVVDIDQARSGVDHGKYYFMLELPPDFSEAIASPVTGQPKKADLIAVYNDANNYISSSIGRTAVDQVLNAVSTRISGQAVNQVLSVVVSSGSGIKQAADGAKQLADGGPRSTTAPASWQAACIPPGPDRRSWPPAPSSSPMGSTRQPTHCSRWPKRFRWWAVTPQPFSKLPTRSARSPPPRTPPRHRCRG